MRSGFEFGVVGLDSGAARFRRCEEWCAMIERCWKMEKVETGEKKKKKRRESDSFFLFRFGFVLFVGE